MLVRYKWHEKAKSLKPDSQYHRSLYLDAPLFQDKVLKVWDITGDSPGFVAERDVKLGALHDVSPCPDAPFVMVMGGDKRDDNLKVRQDSRNTLSSS